MNLSQVKWSRIIVSVIAVILLTYLVVTLIIAGYAALLVILKASPGSVENRITSIGKIMIVITYISYLIFIFLAAIWSNRKLLPEQMVHGMIIGILVVIIDIPLTYLFNQHIRLFDVFGYLLILGVGYAGDQYCMKGSLKSKVRSPKGSPKA
ncbi:MAG: hypothetical protein ACE14V_11240 [bacterium]